MAFNPQNILSLAKAGGFSLDNAVSEIQSKIPNLQQATNIDINGTLSGVQSQAQAVINGAVQKLAGKIPTTKRYKFNQLTGLSNLNQNGGPSALNDLGGGLSFSNQLESFH